MKPTILVVEDELLIAMDIKGILEHEGYNVIINLTTVNDAIQAIETYQPVLVLLDINLKQDDDDGISLGHYLLSKDTIPYIYITSFSDNVTLDRVKDTRPHGMIVKPFKTIDVRTAVSIVLNNYKHKKIDILRQEEKIDDAVPFIIKGVVAYINDHIDKRIDIDQLAQTTKWTYMHFIRMFTKFMGVTPYQYILKKKIAKSIVLITETDIPLSNIAADVSFSNYTNFCTVFKRETGKSPDNFRKFHSIKKYLEP